MLGEIRIISIFSTQTHVGRQERVTLLPVLIKLPNRKEPLGKPSQPGKRVVGANAGWAGSWRELGRCG